jgi:SNF2 family DNA or RNA helicase
LALKNIHTELFFGVLLKKHSRFGFLMEPYVLKKTQGSIFISILEKITTENIRHYSERIENFSEQIAKSLSQISDNSLHKIFCKAKMSSVNFIKTVDSEFIDKHIKPYIEFRLYNTLLSLKENPNVPLLDAAQKTGLSADNEINIHPSDSEAVFNFLDTKKELRYFLSLHHHGSEMKILNSKLELISNNPCTLRINNIIYFIKEISGSKILPFTNRNIIEIPLSARQKYFQTFIYNSVKQFNVHAEGFQIIEIDYTKKAILQLDTDLECKPILKLYFQYNDKKIGPDYSDKKIVKLIQVSDSFNFQIIKRDNEWENRCVTLLQSIDFEFFNNRYFRFPKSGFLSIIEHLNKNHDRLSKLFSLDISFNKKQYFTGEISISFTVNKKIDWFDLKAIVQFGEHNIAFSKLRNNILSNNPEYLLPDGTIAIIPEEWFEKYTELLTFSKIDNNNLKISSFHYSLINSIENIEGKYLSELENIREVNIQQIKLPKKIKATLREYQKIGYYWLMMLRENKFGGCIADDMGLGKTLQTLCLLQKIKEENISYANDIQCDDRQAVQLSLFDDLFNTWPRCTTVKPSMIVVPTSLVYNWVSEINKFTPELRYLVYAGQNRSKLKSDFFNYDVIITTYGIARNDIEDFSNLKFTYIILDESQYIKNTDSLIYKSIVRLEAENKIILTGTPLENSLNDLWAQMNFINPGILGNPASFEKNFIRPIESEKNKKAQQKLKTIIKPFILRRLKSEVEKDLPEKTESIRYCEMSPEQSELYVAEKSKVRNLFLENQLGDSKTRSLNALNALMRLRLLSNHPSLCDENYTGDSSKFDEIIKDIETVTSENHKVLVFSSFVKIIDLLVPMLNEHNIDYCLLTGQTKNRKSVVDIFNSDPTKKVFLISLKAGGVGLNLTSADYVFIVDPWWNPASEEQAVSRSHRIGQKNKVIAYKYITKDSIEEKILKLQKKKKDLADIFVSSNNPLDFFGLKDIIQLFD